MKRKILFIFILLVALGTTVLGQRQAKLFYDNEWKECFEKDASYYRLVTYDIKGKPVGKVKDYYITGEIQSVIDGALYIAVNDDSYSKFIGTSTGYFKSGKRAFINIHNQNGDLISNTHWYENGNKEYTITYKDGEEDGLLTTYYENGNLERQIRYSKGEEVGISRFYNEDGKLSAEIPHIKGEPDTINQKLYYYTDDGSLRFILIGYEDENNNMTGKVMTFNEANDTVILFMNNSKLLEPKSDWKMYVLSKYNAIPFAIFVDDFSNINNTAWQLSEDENATVKILNNRLKIHFYGTRFIRKTPLIQSPMKLSTNDFEVKTVIAKESNAFFEGIIFGYRDSKNYSSLTFSRLAKIVVYEKFENGITVISEEASKIYLVDYADNEIRLIKKNNKIKIFFNGVEGYEIESPNLLGNLVGLCAAAAEKGQEAIFKSFMITIGEQPSAGFENENIVKLKKTGGVYSVPVELNGVLKIDFIFDSGASDVSISPDVALTLVKTGTIKSEDWLPGAYYSFADGSTAKSARFKLKSVKIGNVVVKDVVCSISNSIHAPMLLGQSLLSRFGKYTFDNEKQILILK